MPKISKSKNVFTNKTIIIFVVIVLVIFIMNNEPKKNEKNNSITIVIARYKEDLKWTLEEPFNKFKYIVYNKGDNEEFEKKNVIDIIKLDNIGRDFHTHFYHIVNNYENLSDINIFLPGSIDLYYKKRSAKKMLNDIIKYNEACISLPLIPYINKLMYTYQQKIYKNSSNGNSNVKVFESHIRPFGKWYKSYFTNDLHYLSQFGIYSVNKNDILQHKKSKYETILNQISKNINPEEGFFIEISMYQIFYPYKHTIVKTYYNNFFTSLPSIIDKFFSFYYKNLL